MIIELTEKQYTDLLEVVLLGNWIRSTLFDQGLYPNKDYNDIEDYLLTKATTPNSVKLVEDFEGQLIPSNKLSNKIESIMENYDEFSFWDLLERYLGQRDFMASITEEEKKEMRDNDGWFPERIHQIYAMYEKEIEKNGIENLYIRPRNVK